MTAKKRFSPDPLCLRLAEQAMGLIDGRAVEVIGWLQSLGCQVAYRNDEVGEWHVLGLTGVMVGLTRDMEPHGATVGVATALAGQFWPMVYGDALEINRRAWSARVKLARQAKAAL